MKLLALESATSAGAVALVVDGTVRDERIATTTREHTETLLPTIAALLADAGMRPQDLDAIVIDVGPGLFTGLRVGVATARSLAASSGCSLVAMSSLEILAADPRAGDASTVISLVDARRGEVFAQAFTRSDHEIRACDVPRVLRPEHLGEWAKSLLLSDDECVVVGDGAQRYGDAASAIGVVQETITIPSPAVAAQLAEARALVGSAPETVLPMYLRDPDAVANFAVAPAGPAA